MGLKLKTQWYGDKFIQKLDIDMQKKLEEAQSVLVDSIKKNTPVISGTLRDSIEGIVDKSKKQLSVIAGASYAAFVEFGTRYMSPRFFMTKGYREALPKLKKIFRNKMK